MDSNGVTARDGLQRTYFPRLSDEEYADLWKSSVFLEEVILNFPLNDEESLEMRNLVARCDIEKCSVPLIPKSNIYLKAFTRATGKTYNDLIKGNFDYEAFRLANPEYPSPLQPLPEVTKAVLPPPAMPLSRIVKETGGAGVCPTCGSSLVRKHWLFGKLGCIQPKCSNYIKKD